MQLYARFSVFSEEGFFLKCHKKALSNYKISHKANKKVLKIQTIVEKFQVDIELHYRVKNTDRLGLTILSEVYDLVISIPYHRENQNNEIDIEVLMDNFCKSNIQKNSEVENFMSSYRVAAIITVNRLTDFFQNKFHDIPLETPVFKPLYFAELWLDGDGNELHRTPTWMAHNDNHPYLPKYVGLMGPDNKSYFDNDICSKIKVATEDQHYKESEIYEKIYADSREAYIEGHFHRSVMSLAVACEVAIKTFYFSQTTPAGMAFKYLQEKRKVEVSPVELIHKVAELALGQSFRDYNKKSYDCIEHLFQCRNKVVHQAALSYSLNGKEVTPSKEEINEWLDSANRLFEWLNSKRA
jgi:hypothetical protein